MTSESILTSQNSKSLNIVSRRHRRRKKKIIYFSKVVLI